MADLTGMLQAAAGAAGEAGNPNAWDISKAYYDAGADAGDLSKAVFSSRTFSVNGQDDNPTGVFFKPDGTKMYVTGLTNDRVNEYTLSSAWEVTTATYVRNFSVSSQETSPYALFFKPDGTQMYITGTDGQEVNEYSLSTAWDISSASYVRNKSVSTEEAGPQGLFFKPDGTKMYIAGQSNEVNEYDLSTPWNISTASYVQNFSVAAIENNITQVSFNADGTKMYVIGTTVDTIAEFDLSTAWDISSSSYVQSFSVASQDTSPFGMYMKDDGSLFYVMGYQNDTVYQYTIGGFSVAAQETQPSALFFKSDGTKMYICGGAGDDVNEYSLSSAWDLTTASYVQNFSVASQETSPQGLHFKSDGTKMYVVGPLSDSVHEYALSVAWDISTASFTQSFSVSTQETVPQGLFFKDDGTKMYVIGSNGDDVNEYALSTAWDISSASYTQNFSVASQETSPNGVFFKHDGTKMYVTGVVSDAVNEYSLSTAWDVSSASYVAKVFAPIFAISDLFWKSDGSQFWVSCSSNSKIYSFLISEE